jgi:hypothetical protein
MLHLEVGKFGCPSIRLGGPKQQDHNFMNAHISNNPHARQKWNEKKAHDQMKKKEELDGMNFKPKRNKWNMLNGPC